MTCLDCGGPIIEVDRRELRDQNVVQRRRRCTLCGAEVSTFEVVAGTEITWAVVDAPDWPDPPILRAKQYQPVKR